MVGISGTIGFAFSVLTRLPGHERLIRKLSKRFFAGELFRDVLQKTLELQKLKFGVIINHVGDGVRSENEVWSEAGIQRGILRRIFRFGLRADVSWKLSRICPSVFHSTNRFLVQEDDVTELISLLQLAEALGVRVWWDAGELETRDPTWKFGRYLFERMAKFLGIAFQAYGAGQYDSREFLENIIFPLIRSLPPEKVLGLRLCMGAYQKSEEKDNIIRDSVTLHIRYVEIAEHLLTYVADCLSKRTPPRLFMEFATHDMERIWMIQAFVKRLASKRNLHLELLKRHFRFAMLLGRQESEASHLVADGWNSYIYVPFGSEQIPYVLRRIEERPEYALWGFKKEGKYHHCENPEQCRSKSQI